MFDIFNSRSGIFVVSLGILTELLASHWQIFPEAFGKGNEPLYEDPFDLAAGGASLTKASQAGVLFANPALLPYGGKFHRWVGAEFMFITNKESVATARSLAASSKSSSDETSEDGATAEDSSDETQEYIDKVFNEPVHVGAATSLSYINKFGGLAAFARVEPDLSAKKYGDTGLPEVHLQSANYSGVAGSMAAMSPWRALSFGLTGKYLYVAEPDLVVDAADQTQMESLQSGEALTALTSFNRGVGLDVGSLLFLQGSVMDFRLAAKVDDLGNTKLVGPTTPSQFKQVMSVGTGVTFHSEADALHLSLDYRDISGSYGEDLFKRVRLGAKITLRTYVGVAMGYHHGFPSYGAEIDFILFRISGTYYTRELGDHPNVAPRRLYMLSFSMGV